MLSLSLIKEFRHVVAPFRLDVRYDIGDEHKSAVLFESSGSGKTLIEIGRASCRERV